MESYTSPLDLKKLANQIADSVIEIYNGIGDACAEVIDFATSPDLEFKDQLKNKQRIERILETRENLIGDDYDSSSTTTVLSDFIDIGQTPNLAKTARSYLLTFCSDLSKKRERLANIVHMMEGSFLTWFNASFKLGDGTTPFAHLWDSYVNHTPNESWLNKKQIAHVFQELGAVPSVINVSGKATRVYKGIIPL